MSEVLPAELLGDPRRITVLWIGRLGDFVITTPILRSLRHRFPKARISLVVGDKGREIAALCPSVDEILTLHSAASPVANLRLAAGLFAQPADLLVDLNSAASRASTALAWVARARVKLAFEKSKGDWAFTRLLPKPSDTEHMLDRYARMAAALGAPYEPAPSIDVPSEQMDEADAALRKALGGKPDGPVVAIHPGNFKKYDNRWPEEKFVELTERLLKAGYGSLLYMAGPGEENEVAAIVARLSRKVPVLPPMPMALTAAVLAQIDLLIVNATGTAHLAAAVGTPTFCFLGRYTKTVWMPRAGPHRSVVSDSWESCREITVDAAWRELEPALKELASHRTRR
ncbi:MAG: glycosyltransferase family 9 protein [Elusimicrobia bacterium]|nr:glycosyltransferase family 9 protein [Elusimicrobiota bacterium]